MDEKQLFLDAQSRYFDILTNARENSSLMRLPREIVVPCPEIFGMPWFTFHCHARDYVLGLRNTIEVFGTSIHRLTACHAVLQTYEEAFWPWLLEETVLPIAISTILTPFMIRERFVYCACMLLHFSAHLKDPDAKPALNEKRIRGNSLSSGKFLDIAKQLGLESLTGLNAAVVQINADPQLEELRNRMTHRLPPNVEYGIVTMLARVQSGNKVAYGLGGEQPIRIAEVVPLLVQEHENCIKAYERFNETVNELIQTWESLNPEIVPTVT